MAQSCDALADFKNESFRGHPGYFRVARTPAGQWWFIDPTDRPFFARAVHEVAASTDSPRDPAARLRSWGFNTLGCGCDQLYLEEGLPFLATVNFCDTGMPLRLAGVKLPDVFDASWSDQSRARAAKVCAPLAENRMVLGWLPDDGAGWVLQPTAEQPGLLQVCLSLEPSLAAYHAAWEFALALQRGRLDVLAKSWGVNLANKGAVREMTRREQGIATRGYLHDDERWVSEFARRYYGPAVAAIREYAPRHLVLGSRWRKPAGEALLKECAAVTDVCLLDHTEIPERASFPVMLGDFSWAQASFRATSASARGRALGPTAVERMLRRGRRVLTRAVAHPAVVGYAWSRWQDRSAEQPPFGSGLVHCNENDAREHTELLTAINDRVEELRAMALIPEETP